MGWANRITLGRGILTLALWVLIEAGVPRPSERTWWIAFALFVVTALTDAIDGIVARRLQEVSRFGRIADPFVDKMMILGTMAVLLDVDGMSMLLPGWAVALILTREILVTAVRGAVEGRGISFQAVFSGKGKMLLQTVAVGAVMLHGAGLGAARAAVPGLAELPGGGERWNVAHVLVLLATIATVVSGVLYARRAVKLLRAA